MSGSEAGRIESTGISAFLFWIGDLISKLAARRSAANKALETGERAFQNIRYAPDSSLLILWVALNEPNGRMPSIGNIPSMQRLRDLEIMKPEDVWGGIDEGEILTVNGVVYERRDQILPLIRERLSALKLDDQEAIAHALRQQLVRERGW